MCLGLSWALGPVAGLACLGLSKAYLQLSLAIIRLSWAVSGCLGLDFGFGLFFRRLILGLVQFIVGSASGLFILGPGFGFLCGPSWLRVFRNIGVHLGVSLLY